MWSALRGGLSKGPWPVFTRVSEKNHKNSEQLGRQAQPGIEPGTSRLSALSVVPVSQWWDRITSESECIFIIKSGAGYQ